MYFSWSKGFLLVNKKINALTYLKVCNACTRRICGNNGAIYALERYNGTSHDFYNATVTRTALGNCFRKGSSEIKNVGSTHVSHLLKTFQTSS